MSSLNSVIRESLQLLGRYEVECVIVGGVAATLHGSTLLTNDLDVCYKRSDKNLERLVNALKTVNARLRNAPPDLPFKLDKEALKHGLNFTFTTDLGSLDLLGEVLGLGYYKDVVSGATTNELFGYRFPVVSLEKLIVAKKTAGRRKDLVVIPELEALLEGQD